MEQLLYILIHYLYGPACAQNIRFYLALYYSSWAYVVIKPGPDKALKWTHDLPLTVATYLLQ
jgi:hypothetical protein